MAEPTTNSSNSIDTTGFAKPKSNLFKYGKCGDIIKGVYLGSKDFEGNYGPSRIHQLKAIAGHFHDIVDDKVEEKPTDVKEGEMYGLFEKNTFADDIAQAVPGQEVIIAYREDRKPKSGGKPYKYVECLLGPMAALDEPEIPEM